MTALSPGAFGARTTLRVGGPAAFALDVGSLEELVAAVEHGLTPPLYVLGRGSNTLVADEGFQGTVIHLGDGFSTVEVDRSSGRVLAGGAADLPVVARRSVDAGLTGFEWAVGVPGSVGGATRMNAGGHGSDMAASLVDATVMNLVTGEITIRPADALELRYRSSALAAYEAVLGVQLRLEPGDPERGRAQLREIVRWRREHQPGGANCGSVFANPPHGSAGQLIDDAGLRGLRMGTAAISSKHANFIQADPGGSADDVAALIAHVVEVVAAHSGVVLSSEVRLVGFDGAT